jgi:hypothetical protein
MTTATSIAPSLAPALCPAKVAICKSRVGTKTFELRVISVWFYKYLYSPPSDLSVCEGARKFANQMPIAHISRMVEQFEVRMTKSYFQLPT